MDVDACFAVGPLAHHPRDQGDAHLEELVGDAVGRQALDVWVGEDHLPNRRGGGISVVAGLHILLQIEADLWQQRTERADDLVGPYQRIVAFELGVLPLVGEQDLPFEERTDLLQLLEQDLVEGQAPTFSPTPAGKHQFKEFTADLTDDLHLGKRLEAVEVGLAGDTVIGRQQCRNENLSVKLMVYAWFHAHTIGFFWTFMQGWGR